MGSSRDLGGANKGLGEAPKAARGRSMKARPTQSRGGVKGQLPLAGSRDSVPCGVWGNAPTVPRATNSKRKVHKGAGSEASLPVTLRSRRSAPKLLYPSTQHCRARWARPDCMTFDHSRSFSQAEGFASAEATRGQWKQTKSAVAPLTPSQCTPMLLVFYRSRKDSAPAGAILATCAPGIR